MLDSNPLHCDLTLIAIGNGHQYGGGKKITPDARLDDGLFDVTLVGPISRRRLVRIAPTLPRAGHIGAPEVTTYRAKDVSIDCDDVICYADGERIGPPPITARCVPQALPVLLPDVS
jgi:diacylglycerol kinase (ATP)